MNLLIITARIRSCGKVMFLQVSVILFTGEMPGPGGFLVQRGCLVPRGGSWSGGLLVGCVCSGGGGSGPGGGMPGGDSPGTATAAGGTHPTGMHSCFSRTFTEKPCQSLHTQKSRQIFYQPEPDFWMVMVCF